MKTLASWAPAPHLNVIAVERGEPDWIVSVDSRDAKQDRGHASCPVCGTPSSSRHSSYLRTLRDLSAQGTPVNIQARLTRWRCRNDQCDRRIFAERVPRLAIPFARRTARLAEIVRLFGHSVGGRPSERLMARLGMPVSDTTILRRVKECAGARPNRSVVRVAGIDESAWRKGTNFGMVIVDLERRQVVDLLADRSAATTAAWLKRHPEIEVVSRDRAGLYADAARQGAPQARQVADRFHLLKNFRETIERQHGRFEAPIRESPIRVEDDLDPPEQPVIDRSDRCSEVVADERRVRRGRDAARQIMFDKIRALYEAGSPVTEIARKLGIGPRRVYRWVRRIDFPEPSVMAPKTCTPAYFGTFLARSWAEGTTKVRHLFSDIPHRGYTGSYSHLARFLAPWRDSSPSGEAIELPFFEPGSAGTAARADAGSDDGPSDLAADRGGALREAAWPDDCPADRQRRCAQGGVSGIHHDASSGNAVPRTASWRNGGGSGHLADRCTHVRHLWYAAFCQDLTAGHRGRSQCRAGTLEQWSDGRTDQ